MFVKIFKKIGKKGLSEKGKFFHRMFEAKCVTRTQGNTTGFHVLSCYDGQRTFEETIDLAQYGYEIYENGKLCDRWA